MTEPTATQIASAIGTTTPAPRSKPKSTVEKTRAAANKALDKTLAGAHDAADRTAKAINANPIPVLAGGLVIGALAGALIPRSKREVELLAPVGQRIKTTATGAVTSAKQTGLAELGALGLSRDALGDQAGKLVGGILTALVTAGTAAVTASREVNSKKAAD